MPRILITPEASDDLVEIALYIESDSVEAADRTLDRLHATTQKLSEFPGMGPARDELALGLRSFPVAATSSFISQSTAASM
jgi:plasmid stabilization system protein ParE